MDLIAKYGEDRKNIQFFDTGEIICTVENGSSELFGKLVETIEEHDVEIIERKNAYEKIVGGFCIIIKKRRKS